MRFGLVFNVVNPTVQHVFDGILAVRFGAVFRLRFSDIIKPTVRCGVVSRGFSRGQICNGAFAVRLTAPNRTERLGENAP